MMACGAMVRDQVQEHSTSVTGMCSKDHGGTTLCMERYSFEHKACIYFSLEELPPSKYKITKASYFK